MGQITKQMSQVSHQLLIKYDNADELCSRNLGEILGSATLILRENSNFTVINWEHHLVATELGNS